MYKVGDVHVPPQLCVVQGSSRWTIWGKSDRFGQHHWKKLQICTHCIELCARRAPAYQMRASVAEGRPVFRKMSRTSGPDTRPSMSPSVLLNSSSYLAFSAGETTHWEEPGHRERGLRHPVQHSTVSSHRMSTVKKNNYSVGWVGFRRVYNCYCTT